VFDSQHTTTDMRLSASARVVGEQFAHGYAEEMADIEEPENETDDALEMSAGRGGEIGTNRYGVSVDIIKHLSSRTVDIFRSLSEKWHEFLGLDSCKDKGQKRTREERSNSTYVEQEQVHSERRIAIVRENNGIHNWHPAVARRAPVTPMLDHADSAWWFGQSSQARSTDSNRAEAIEHRIGKAVRTVLRCEDFSFKSNEQKEALYTIVVGEHKMPLVVVLPTGGGKSLLFMAPTCLDDPGVTIVVVPYRALINNLIATARQSGIDCIEFRPGEVNPAALVFVSADFVPFSGSFSYARIVQEDFRGRVSLDVHRERLEAETRRCASGARFALPDNTAHGNLTDRARVRARTEHGCRDGEIHATHFSFSPPHVSVRVRNLTTRF